MAHPQGTTIGWFTAITALTLALGPAAPGCKNSGSGPSDWDDDSAVGDDDATADDDDSGTDDDDTGDDDDAQDCSGGSGAAVEGEFLTVGDASTWLYVPEGVIACAPLILLGHGGSHPGGILPNGLWNDQLGTGLAGQAAQLGFALMVPYLEDAPNTEHPWNTAEVHELDEMIDAAANLLDIDRNRVLFAGQSAGGHMAAYYGLYEPGNAPQIAVISAGLGGYFDYPSTEPDPKLPFFVAHDPNDEIVPYSYSVNLTSELDAHGHEYVFDDYELGSNGHGWSAALTEDLLDWWL